MAAAEAHYFLNVVEPGVSHRRHWRRLPDRYGDARLRCSRRRQRRQRQARTAIKGLA